MHQNLIIAQALLAAFAQSSVRNDFECNTNKIEFANISPFEGPTLSNLDQIRADLWATGFFAYSIDGEGDNSKLVQYWNLSVEIANGETLPDAA